jgi:hypothetical protein
MSMRLSCANTKLSKATAVAVINQKVNGEMEDALEYMKSLDKEQELFIQRQGIENIFKANKGENKYG